MLQVASVHLLPLMRCRRAVVAVEYAILGSCIFLVIVAGVQLLGTNESAWWANIAAKVSAVQS